MLPNCAEIDKGSFDFYERIEINLGDSCKIGRDWNYTKAVFQENAYFNRNMGAWSVKAIFWLRAVANCWR